MTKAEIISKVLIDMGEVIGSSELRVLKDCLHRSLYGVVLVEESTEITEIVKIENEELLKKFLFEKKIEGLSDATLSQYKRETERFLGQISKHYSEVKSDDVYFFLAILMGRKLSVNSVDNARKFIKPFFKWLYENEYINKDIFINIRPMKRIEKQKEYLTNEEIARVREVSQDDTRSLALIDFLLSTGIRVSECSNLKISDVDFMNGEASIYATKTNEWRKVYLDPNAIKHLQDYLNMRIDSSPYLFANLRRSHSGEISRMSKNSIEKIISKHCRKANVNKHCTVHIFRKTLATRLYKRGMDITAIARILGHSSVTTTEKYYLTVCDSHTKYQYKKCIRRKKWTNT